MSRNTTVPGLSGKVTGLKFMQRGSLPSAPSTPTPVGSTTPQSAEASPAPQDEQWVLPKKVAAPTTSCFEHEAGWDAWRLDQENLAAGKKYLRRTYGRFDAVDSKPEDEQEPDFEEEEEEDEPPSPPRKTFVKPGTGTKKEKSKVNNKRKSQEVITARKKSRGISASQR